MREKFVFALRMVFMSDADFDGARQQLTRIGYYSTQARAMEVASRVMLPADRLVSLTIKAIRIED